MDPKDVADIVYYASSVPKNIELSEIIINRK
jgi:NADP-dependent 3-hydroxy acid dehydrogenase YdfG